MIGKFPSLIKPSNDLAASSCNVRGLDKARFEPWSIVLEASELAEFTQWARDGEIAEISRERHAEIVKEVADIAILLSYLAHDLGIDLEQAVAAKLELNARRYPVSKAKGTAKKYDQLG